LEFGYIVNYVWNKTCSHTTDISKSLDIDKVSAKWICVYETNPYDCATNKDNHVEKGNEEPSKIDPYDCATDNGKLLKD